MPDERSVDWSRALWRTALALPALVMIAPVLSGGEPWRQAIRPTGEFGAMLLIAALAISPLQTILPNAAWVAWLRHRRRDIGLAAFLYTLLHLIVFSASIGRLDWIVQGIAFASMWTGWLAFGLLAAVAAISNEGAMRRLGPWWKRVQRLAYPAALLTLAHWLLLTRSPVEGLLYFAPLTLLQALRVWITLRAQLRTERDRP
ncbi:MAG: ferric reductase-like transmembrane domain-containing protein [Mesorhizobium sp.]|nr:ferric reductase-like transmembrane domain-containing protein [Mesorhizobium sp.]